MLKSDWDEAYVAAQSIVRKVDFVEAAGQVRRSHTVPCIHPQNVAAHSYGVAWWCYLLANNKPSANLIMAALQHDNAEHVTGDIPSPTKSTLGVSADVDKWEAEILQSHGFEMFPLTDEERQTLRLADIFELAQFCIREAQLGNRTKSLQHMFCNVHRYAEGICVSTVEKQILETLQTRWVCYSTGVCR